MSEPTRGETSRRSTYKGDRDFVGGKIPLDVVERAKTARTRTGASQVDWIEAAFRVALNHPGQVDAYLRKIMRKPAGHQLAFEDHELGETA